MNVLGVAKDTLRRSVAVSRECASEMACGVRDLTGASVGVAITGIAGPGGGTPSKPVGLVYVALSGPGRLDAVHELRLGGTRETIRERAATQALHFLLKTIS